MVWNMFKGLLTADIRALLMFNFFFFVQQENPIKSLSGSMMLNEYGLQGYLAHEEARISNNMSSTPNEIRGTQCVFTPYLLYPYYHVLLKEYLTLPDRYWFL